MENRALSRSVLCSIVLVGLLLPLSPFLPLKAKVAARAASAILERPGESPVAKDLQPASPPPGVDLDVTYISREPRYEWLAAKKWPDVGEAVTFTAHVTNKGTQASAAFQFEWLVDGQVVGSGTSSGLAPQGETTRVFPWAWQTGRHYVGFRADPGDLILETAESNNSIQDATDALSIAFWVEESVFAQFNNYQNGAGTYSWEDWAQRILAQMNWMFERSAYPLAPHGLNTRVRLDEVTRAPDGTLFNQGPWHAPYEATHDGRWGFSVEEYSNCSDLCYDTPWWVIHELGHYLLGVIDLYAFDVQAGDVKVLDKSGNPVVGTPELPYIYWDVVHYASRMYDVMHVPSPYAVFSDHSAWYLQQEFPMGVRFHYGREYWLDIPNETRLRVLNNNGQSMPGVQVTAYQAVGGDGSSGPYSQNFDNVPDIAGVTDGLGIVTLGHTPFGNIRSIGTPAGVVLIRLEDPASGELGYVWLELPDVNLAYWRGQTGMYTHDVRFPVGPKRLRLTSNSLTFLTLPGSIPAPQNIQVEVMGEGVQYWSVSDSPVPWLRTIPGPDVAEDGPCPSGPLTAIADSADLPPGRYTSQLIVDGGPGTLDSPQVVTVTLLVVEPVRVFLPFVGNGEAPR